MTKKAAFSFENFKIERVNLDISKREGSELDISFDPSGQLHQGKAEVKVVFKAKTTDNDPFIEVEFTSSFKFEEKIKFEDIPNYFYINSIAIVFPYIRAFISNLTLQANIFPPVILPTWNLTSLAEPLKKSMINKDSYDTHTR